MRFAYQKLLLIAMCGTLTFLLSGCFLQLLVGRVFVRTIGEEVEQIIAAVFSNTTTAVCTEEEFLNEAGQRVKDVECTYIIASEEFPFIPEQTSTAQLISEFGILGVFIDPVILQVPTDATDFVGTFDDGSGPEPIVITEVASFKADVNTEVLPESGQKFVILEFPFVPADGTNFDFNLEFELPSLAAVNVKPMFAGKVEVNGDTFYPPMLPCTTDFSSIPEVTIPVSDFDHDLSFQLAVHLLLETVTPCDGRVYDFTGAGAANPAIDVQKSPDMQMVSTGSDAVFEIRVENTGDVELSDVTVTDALTPDCDAAIGPMVPAQVVTYECTAPGVTDDFVNVAGVSATAPGGPARGVTDEDTASVVVIANQPPDCSDAAPSTAIIWPPDHRFVPISIMNVTDLDGDAISITIDGIWQDEPVDSTGDGKFVSDGTGVGTDTAHVRAERIGGSGSVKGNGRVYHIFFTADDGNGGTCSGEVLVGVPHDQGQGREPVDDGPLYDSTQT